MFKRLQDGTQKTEMSEDSVDEPVRQTAGQYLRQKREEFGYDLHDVAEQLRIRHVYLVAIEDDRLDDLPGATYAVGFVRAYAEYLRLDGPVIVERFKAETAELAKAARLVFPSPQPEGKVPSGTILLFSLVVAALVYGGWVFLSSRDRPIAELVPALPERFLALIGQSDPVPTQSEPAEPAAVQPTAPSVPPAAAAETPAAKPDLPPVTPAPLKPVVKAPVDIPAETVAAAEPEPEKTANPDGSAVSEALEQFSSQEQPSAGESPAETLSAPEITEQLTSAPAATNAAIPSTEEETVTAATQEIVATSENLPAAISESPAPVASVPESGVDTVAVTDGSPAAPNSESVAALPRVGPDFAALPPPPPTIDPARTRVYGEENTDARVVLRATEEVWVQVRDNAGNLLLTRLLRTGDSYRVPNVPGLIMRTGNAGGLDILVDGNRIPRIGSKGTVLKEVVLNADMLNAGTASRQ